MAYVVKTIKAGEGVTVHADTREKRIPKRSLLFGSLGVFNQSPGAWPMESDAAGVNPEQIQEAMAADRAAGVPTEYNPRTGAVIWRDANHRKEHCRKVLGLRDRNGGYGDP